MHSGTQEKLELEQQAAELFAAIYPDNQGECRFLHHNLPPKPDATLLINNKPQDIEIAHLYGSEEEAQLILGKDLDTATRDALRAQSIHTHTDDRLINALNRILASKAEKHYHSVQPWLVIRNMHPAWNKQAIEQYCHRIDVVYPNPFEKIWLIADRNGKSGLVQLS